MGDAEIKAQLKDIFTLIDADGGGTISEDEVVKFVASFPKPPTEEETRRLVQRADADGSGEIDDEEFCKVAQDLEALTGLGRDEMVGYFKSTCYRELFAAVEGGNKGTVSMSNLRNLVEAMGTKHSSEDIRKIFAEYDADGSGTIDFDEFTGIANRIGEDLPISAVVHGFQKAQEKARSRMMQIKGWFRMKETESDGSLSHTPSRPGSPAPQSPPPCSTCPELRKRILELEGELSVVRRELEEERGAHNALKEGKKAPSPKPRRAARDSGAVKELKERVAELEQKLDAQQKEPSPDASYMWSLETAVSLRGKLIDRLKQLLADAARKADRPLKDHLEAALKDVVKEAADQERSLGKACVDGRTLPTGAAPESDQSYIWALETAVALRGKEVDRLKQLIQDVAAKAERVAPSISQALRGSLEQAVRVTAQQEKESLGGPLDTTLHQQRRHRKPVRQASASPPPGEAKLKNEVAALKQQLAAKTRELERVQQEKTQRAVSASHVDTLMQTVAQKDLQLAKANTKLTAAQEAIVASAGIGFENEIKLMQARSALQNLVDRASPGRARSKSPASHRSVSPAVASQRSASPSPTSLHNYYSSMTALGTSRTRSRSASPDPEAEARLLAAHPDLAAAPPKVRATVIEAFEHTSRESIQGLCPTPAAPPAYIGAFPGRTFSHRVYR